MAYVRQITDDIFCASTFFRLGFPRSLRDLREPLVTKIYAKQAERSASPRVQWTTALAPRMLAVNCFAH